FPFSLWRGAHYTDASSCSKLFLKDFLIQKRFKKLEKPAASTRPFGVSSLRGAHYDYELHERQLLFEVFLTIKNTPNSLLLVDRFS
ncbi:hypothetical protein, partial [Teredinibacter turnerae]|uniref:hypothetical protein n=1 Tax=Teredinibacter turnerae TaxID=2426 RepID=UPI001E611350